MKKWFSGLILFVYLLFGAIAGAQPSIPPVPTSSFYVQDYAGVISPETEARINSLGNQLATKTKAQVVVVTLPTLEGMPSHDYALGILRQWGVGDKTLNNGVVILVSVADRQSRIEVGYGLEGPLPDGKTGSIQDEFMIPYFQQGDYDKGILNGYRAVAGVVAKEYKLELKTEGKPAPVATTTTSSLSWWDELPWWMQALMIAGLVLLLLVDWLFLGGTITYLLLSIISRGRGGGSGGGGFGGGSGGGGGSGRKW